MYFYEYPFGGGAPFLSDGTIFVDKMLALFEDEPP